MRRFKTTDEYRKERQKLGFCRDCTRKALPNRHVCGFHSKKLKEDRAKRYKHLVSSGLCAHCGKLEPIKERILCSICSISVKQQRNNKFFHYRAIKFNCVYKTNHTAKGLASMWKHQRGLCALTGFKLTRENAELDHRIPKSKSGPHSLENLRWVIKVVNRIKRDLLDEEFFRICHAVTLRANL